MKLQDAERYLSSLPARPRKRLRVRWRKTASFLLLVVTLAVYPCTSPRLGMALIAGCAFLGWQL